MESIGKMVKIGVMVMGLDLSTVLINAIVATFVPQVHQKLKVLLNILLKKKFNMFIFLSLKLNTKLSKSNLLNQSRESDSLKTK